jgi:hypothetical protein
MAMDFWRSLARRESTRVREAAALTTAEEAKLDAVLEAAKGNRFSCYAEEYVTGVRSGRYLAAAKSADIALSAESLATGVLIANMLDLGRKSLPQERQLVVVFDHQAGTGADLPLTLADLTMGSRSDDEHEALLLGSVTCWGNTLHQRLRIIVLAPCSFTQGEKKLEGEIGIHYGYLSEDGFVAINKIVQPVSYQDGVFKDAPKVEVGDPDDNNSRLIRAAFAVNQATAHIHPLHGKRK